MASAYATTRYYKQIKMKFKFIFYNRTPQSSYCHVCGKMSNNIYVVLVAI